MPFKSGPRHYKGGTSFSQTWNKMSNSQTLESALENAKVVNEILNSVSICTVVVLVVLSYCFHRNGVLKSYPI